MPQPIIAGIDGTSDSLLAAGWAAGEARRLRTPLVLLHGYTPLAGTSRLLAGDADLEHRAAGRLLDGALAWVREHYDDVEVSADLAVRPEAELLTERGREAQMIVLGSRRPGPVAGFLLRSVGLRVLSQAVCPVVMIRGGAVHHRPQDGEVTAGVPRQEEEAEAVLDFAFRTAATRSAPLRAVRAWTPPTAFTYEPELVRRADERGGLEAVHRHDLAALLEPWRRRHPGVTVIEHVEPGPASEVLVALASSAQLLVVGRRGDPVNRYVGHVAHATLHFADAPIALVPTR
ncbi:universal stress protein [Streptomyces pilosus]|uniref:Universal stress protein n=1 Tax=Streptomyces pilosus TaxID=28893 RepID=A0A918EW64_9ACTN|nr:universal stress protein [Streptomyces pilosus]GGQ70587.1 universal stress protein [Streptomyces pilosus]